MARPEPVSRVERAPNASVFMAFLSAGQLRAYTSAGTGRDGGARRVVEAQGPVGGVADADPGRHGDTSRRPSLAQGELGASLEEVPPGEPRVDAESAAQSAGAAAGVWRRGPLRGSGSAARIEDAPRDAGAVHGQVQAVVHAVDEVDVEGARRAEERRRPRRAATGDVGRGIALAEVGLDLDDADGQGAPTPTAHQHAPDQAARGLRRRPGKEGPETSAASPASRCADPRRASQAGSSSR